MSTQIAARERPIVFSGESIRAILEGRKTQTRRMVNPQPEHQPALLEHADRHRWSDGFDFIRSCPYGQPGDRLWCKEAWQDYCPMWDGYWCGHGTPEGIAAEHRPVYRADDESKWLRGREGKERPPLQWRPAITMPRWASRITLENTSVRIERSQEIGVEDELAEEIGAWIWVIEFKMI